MTAPLRAKAIMLAGALGVCCYALVVTTAEVFEPIKAALDFPPVGALAGKTTLGVILWLTFLGLFGCGLGQARLDSVSDSLAKRLVYGLVVLSLLGTFPFVYGFLASLIGHGA